MRRAVPLVLVVLLLCACSSEDDDPPQPTAQSSSAVAPAPRPELQVTQVAGGLEHAWDIGFLPDGSALVTERPGRIKLLSSGDTGATVTEVTADLADVHVRGEGGLMGLVVHPDFAQTRRFTTCQTHQVNGQPLDVQLVTWVLSPDKTFAERVRDPLLAGLPLNPSGRHSGCRPTMGPDGALYVGTGDSANPAIPQDLTRPGGKVLRLDLATGGPAPGNPFADAEDPTQQLVFTYGHRNIQGVTVQPGTDRLFSAEHGPDVDDEVNLLRPGANYGWDPSRGGTGTSYDESVPMTDRVRFPEAVPAVWSSGDSTEAICGAAFLEGAKWGALEGTLAVAALKGSKLLLMTVDEAGLVTGVETATELDRAFGRLRAVRPGPDGDLYVTTSNGSDDRVLRVSPKP